MRIRIFILVKFANMKRSTISVYSALSFAVLLFAWGCRSARGDQGDSLQPTQWQQTPVIIDGNDSDWVKPLRYYAQKEKLAYNITSDSANVYVQMTSKDEETQEKIIKGGLTVWFNSHAEMSEERAAGISFPTGSEGLRRDGAPISGKAASANQSGLPGLDSYRLFSFSSPTAIDNYQAGQVSDEGVEVGLNFNAAGDLVYEAKVPLKVLYPKVSSGVYANRNLAVGFYIEGILPQRGERGSGRGGGGGISIGGGFGMGSFGGSGMGVSIGSGSLGRIGGGGGGGKKAKQTRVWQTVYLAKAPRG